MYIRTKKVQCVQMHNNNHWCKINCWVNRHQYPSIQIRKIDSAIAHCEYNTSDIVIYKMNTHLILILVIHITFYLVSFYILHLQLHFLCSLKCSTTFELWTLMILIPLLAKLPQMVRTFVPQIR